jgi:hypothetical protein
MLNGFVKATHGLYPKLEGENPECYYKTLWQRFWMCDNLTYDPELDDTEVRNDDQLCYQV